MECNKNVQVLDAENLIMVSRLLLITLTDDDCVQLMFDVFIHYVVNSNRRKNGRSRKRDFECVV